MDFEIELRVVSRRNLVSKYPSLPTISNFTFKVLSLKGQGVPTVYNSRFIADKSQLSNSTNVDS